VITSLPSAIGTTTTTTFYNPTDNFDADVDSSVFMLAEFGEALCSLLLAILATYFGGRKLTYITMLAIHNLHVEYSHYTVNQMYEKAFQPQCYGY